jgi:hypothetical protein
MVRSALRNSSFAKGKSFWRTSVGDLFAAVEMHCKPGGSSYSIEQYAVPSFVVLSAACLIRPRRTVEWHGF